MSSDDSGSEAQVEVQENRFAKAVLNVDDVSSDEEAPRNTVGNVPLEWYKEEEHIGYTLQGHKLVKRAGQDRLDDIIRSRDDPNFKWTIFDEYNDEEIVLNAREVELLRRVQAGQFPHPEHDPYPAYVDYVSGVPDIHAMHDMPVPKRRFLPSKWEAMKVMRIAKGIREGRVKFDTAPKKEEVYDLWADDSLEPQFSRHMPRRIPAPKEKLPGHAHSYNPPEEYLMTVEERKAWELQDPSRRALPFVPKQHGALRLVPSYPQFIHERFERCLDLYLCPRAHKEKLSIDPKSLVPQLPKPRELRPFPNVQALQFEGHAGRVRSVSFSPSGEYLASAAEDGTVRVWEVDTGRCERAWQFHDVVHHIAWNPNPALNMLAVAVRQSVLLLYTGTGDAETLQATQALASRGVLGGEAGEAEADGEDGEGSEAEAEAEEEEAESDAESDDGAAAHAAASAGSASIDPSKPAIATSDPLPSGGSRKQRAFRWRVRSTTGFTEPGVWLEVQHQGTVQQVVWHLKGDYLGVVLSGVRAAVALHHVSKRQSRRSFRKNANLAQAISFHPTKPWFLVATQRHVRVYDLLEQKQVKRLVSGMKWISSLAVHPSGDHVVAGSYDRRVCWFDIDMSSTAFKTMRFHGRAVRSVAFHATHPLMASASDDGTIQVFHTRVYNDFTRNPLIVPVKVLRGHNIRDDLGVLACAFHPTQPWLASAGADGTVRLYQNIP